MYKNTKITCMRQRQVGNMKLNQPLTMNIQKGHKVTGYSIWLGSSCPLVCCHVNMMFLIISYG
jgi:hypothetical protein